MLKERSVEERQHESTQTAFVVLSIVKALKKNDNAEKMDWIRRDILRVLIFVTFPINRY